jgi:sugar phosphate permease
VSPVCARIVSGTLATTDRYRSREPVYEGDFSPRKIKIATAILIGQTFATSILPYSAFSLLIIPFTRHFGWTRTDFSFATTFTFIFGAASLWPIGRLADRIGVRPVILIGTGVVGLVTLAMSLQTASLTQLYAYYALLGIFGSTGVVYLKLIAALFTQNRGKALAILGAESTVAAALVPLMTNALLLHFGWQAMYLAFGALILAIVPLLYFTLEEPGQAGSRPSLRRGPGARRPVAQPAAVLEGMSIKEALHDSVFWLITLAGMAGMVIATGVMSHIVPALIGKGFSQTLAVEMTSLATVVGLGGTLVGGYLVDRFFTAKVAAPFSVLSARGAFLLMVVTASHGGLAVLVVAMALGGFALNAYRPMGTYFQTRYFGLAAFTEIAAVQYMIINPITAFSTPLVGAIYDRTHSYHLAFVLMALTPLAAGAIWLILPRYRYSAHIGQAPPPPRHARA